jgi:hypothetical protein
MNPTDAAFLVVIFAIILYIIDSDSGGGKRGRLPVAIRA